MMDFDHIMVKESPGLCRCCLSEGCYKDLGTEYTWMSDTEVYADMLLECFDISITQHNEGPNGPNRLICEVCITRLRDACNFKKQVLESEKKFIDMVGRGEFRPKVLIYQGDMKLEEQVQESTDEAEVEYLEEDLNYVDDNIAKEEVEVEDSSTYEDITVSALPVKGKRGRPRKNAATVKTDKKAKVSKIEEKPRTSKAVAKDNLPKTRTPSSQKTLRRSNLGILFHNTSVIPFKWKNLFMCFYCGKNTNVYEELKTHTKSHGKCTLKEHSFKQLASINQDVKVDVSELVCNICDSCFVRLDDLIDHLVDDHELLYDRDTFMHMRQFTLSALKCHECDETFVYYSFFISHVLEKHPLVIFTCDHCGDVFYLQKEFNFHRIEHNIECVLNMTTAVPFRYCKNRFRCFHCYSDFTKFESLKKHTVTTHKIIKKYADMMLIRSEKAYVYIDINGVCCKVCNESFKDFGVLIDHLISKHKASYDRTVKNVFNTFIVAEDITCCACDIEFSGLSVFEHINTVHLNLSVICEFCGMVLCDKPSLKSHVLIYHSGAFTCSDCSKDFPSDFQLKLHRYRIHGVKFRNHETNQKVKKKSKKIPCRFCKMKFLYNINLLRHMKKCHKQIDYYECDICSKIYSRKRDLCRHIKMVHKLCG